MLNTYDLHDAYDLRRAYMEKHPEYHFFDNATLRFFGERMCEMKLLKHLAIVTDSSDKNHICYVLSTYQHNAPKPCRIHYYFDVDTLENIIRKGSDE